MRLIPILFAASAAISVIGSSVSAQEEIYPQTESSKMYERKPASPYEPTPAHQYRVARARQQSAHWAAILRSYEQAGIDYAHPVVSATTSFAVANPPRRQHTIYYHPVLNYAPAPVVVSPAVVY